MQKKIAVIGAGFAGISAAAYAAKAGNEVHVFEKNEQAGGRARKFCTDNGYVFDMGPSWYWMPDIIDRFFEDFDYRRSDFYELIALDPQFQIIFSDSTLTVPSDYRQLRNLFEETEQGAGEQLDRFMQAAKYKYETGMQDFVNKPCYSWMEFFSPKIAKSALRLDLLSSFRSYVNRYFRNEKLRTLMEFPVIFLGASPKSIPALYSLMNYGGYALGTWYPLGGFNKLVESMQSVAEEQGATFHFNHPIEKIEVENNAVKSLFTNGEEMFFDFIIAASDYHHTETLLDPEHRNYTSEYWQGKTFAPSCLIYYLGFKQKIDGLQHHNLFFEHDLDMHTDDIYLHKKWPEKPLFYACCTSKTDQSVAPEGHENVFLLMPLSIGIDDAESTREKYLSIMLQRIEKHTGVKELSHKIDYKRSYCVSDFASDYNAYKGNAYGLANTLKQTAVLKPSIRNKKLQNLFYTGQLTVPGPGVPPAIISGRIVAGEVNKLKTKKREKAI